MKRFDYLSRKWRAMTWLVLGRNEMALAIFDDMLERWPDDVYALASRAHLHAQAHRLTLAMADSDRLVAVDPNNAHAWFNRGYLMETAERWEDALAAFRRAAELSPQLDRAWYGQGLVLIRLQRYDEAVAALKRNTELQPIEPVRLVSAGTGPCRSTRSRRGGEDHSPPQGIRAQGGCATRARNRPARRSEGLLRLRFAGRPRSRAAAVPAGDNRVHQREARPRACPS